MLTMLERYTPLWAPEGAGSGSSAAPASSGGGGGSASSAPSAPSSAPSSPSGDGSSRVATQPTESPASAGEALPDNFDMFFRDDGSPPLEGGEAPPTAPSVPPQTAVPPATAAPVAEAPVVPGAAPAAAVESAAPTAGQPQTEAKPPSLDPYDPVALGQHLAQNEDAAAQFVADSMFKLTPQEVEAIESDVIGTIPKLLGKVFVKSQVNVLAQLGRMIPVMIQKHTEAMARNREGEDKFYERWPALERSKHNNLASQYAAAYRQMNPSATFDQMVEAIGPYVMMAAGVQPTVGMPTGHSVGQGAKASANGRPPQQTPFVPAGSGSGPVSQPKTNELSPWEAMFVSRE